MALMLSEKQKQIVEFEDGALLVKAGPGSGKTRVLIERIKRLLKSKKRCKILALTFSNMAAEEMRQRLEEDCESTDTLENVYVGTIHSFALDIVQRRGNLIGLDEGLTLFEDNTDRQKMLREVMSRMPEIRSVLRREERPEKFINECLSMIAEQKKKFVSPDMYEGNESFKLLYREYNQYLLEQNAIDFDDILFYAYRILTENPAVQGMYASLYKYVCVDEAQDLNYAQYELIKALCGKNIKNIMLVGDENQSIYGFNGSNSDLMAETFLQDFSPVIFRLDENFRSAKSIVRYANSLENVDSVSNYYYEGELKAFECDNEEDEAELIVRMIKNLKQNGHPDVEGDLRDEDFAIIGRTRYSLTRIELELQKNSIPFYYKKTINGIECESNYMRIFDLATRVILNSSDMVHRKELYTLLGEKNIDLPFESVLNEYGLEEVIFIKQFLDDEKFDFGRALGYLRKQFENDSIKYADDERYLVLSDIEMWERHWKKYCSLIPRENRNLLSFRNSIALGKTQDIASDKGVAMLTVHMSKGLQYETVFVVGLCEGTFPDYRAVNGTEKELEQEKNNMFVAATRAKRLCYFTYPKYKMMPWGSLKPQGKSRYLNGVFAEKYVPGKD